MGCEDRASDGAVKDLENHAKEVEAGGKGLSVNDRKGIMEILVMATPQLPTEESTDKGVRLPENAEELTEVWLKLRDQKR
jgi:hypothetical protein